MGLNEAPEGGSEGGSEAVLEAVPEGEGGTREVLEVEVVD